MRGKCVVDADLSKYFDNIPYDELMRSITLRIVDREVLRPVGPAPVQSEGPKAEHERGQEEQDWYAAGGVISPLLANRYMNRYLRYWKQCSGERQFAARLVNYADDFVISAGARPTELGVDKAGNDEVETGDKRDQDLQRNAGTEQFDFRLALWPALLHYARDGGRRYRRQRVPQKRQADQSQNQ
ncbi:MAG: hypothetical protein IPJ30_25560 [Acidobacteria bacterium]|nr:hypothetical protein [Acidobacteriota bacterium]